MRTPMTTAEAVERFPCRCDMTDPDWCGCSCTESSTCSTRCDGCGERVWFAGSWSDSLIPPTFRCPTCGRVLFNPFSRDGRDQVRRWRAKFADDR